MGNTANFMPDFETIKLPLAVPGKPNLQAIYGPWNSPEEAREALEWFNTTRDPEGTPITEIPAGSTVAIYDNPETCTSVTEYWWKDGSLVLKSNNNSMIYAIVTDYDFIVYNDVDPTPSLLKVMRINYGLNNISHDMLFGKLGYKVDEGEWNYIKHTIDEDEFIKYDNTNKCFVFYLNNIRPLKQILFRWYATNDDDSLSELLTTKTLLVTATANDIQELYYPTDNIMPLILVDLNTTGSEFTIPDDYATNPYYKDYFYLYLRNNHLRLKTGELEWLDLMPLYSKDNKFNYVYKITRERKYGRWQPFNGPELVFIKGMDGSIKYEEVFYVTNQFGSLNLIETSYFNNAYEYNKEAYDLADKFIINSGSKSEEWSRTCKEVSASNLYRYARKRFLNSEGKYSVDWSYPYLHATYKPSDSYENIYKKAKKGLEEALGTEISGINTYLGEHPDAKFSDLPLEELRGWSYSAESLEESGDIICLAYRGFSEDTVSYYQGPFIIGSYGENGLDGGNVEYIYRSSDQGTVQGFVDSVKGDFGSWNDFASHHADRYRDQGIDDEYKFDDDWSDDCPVRDAVKPYIYMTHRKYSGVDKLWGLYSFPKLWDKFIAYELIVSNNTPLIPSRYEGYSTLAAKNATMTTIRLFAGGDEIETGYDLSWGTGDDVGYTTDGEGNYWLDDGIEKGSGCIVQKDHPYNITVTASYKGVNVSLTIYITRQDTDAYLLHVNPDVRIYLGDNDYSADNYELYVTKLDVNGNYSKDTSGQYLLLLDDVGAEHGSTIMRYYANPEDDPELPSKLQLRINNFINNPEYTYNDLMLYLYHWESRFDGLTDNWIKSNLGERLDVTLINTINASDVIDNIDGNYQIALNYDTLNIPSSKIDDEDWFVNHKIQAKVLHNGQINICYMVAHIDVLNIPGQEDDYLIEDNQRKTEVTSDNGVLNIQIAKELNYEAILTVEAEILYDRGSEYGIYTLTKNIPVHISTEAEVLNLSDNVGVLYADNEGKFGIERVEFTIYDESKELEYTGRDIEIIITCSEQTLSLITTKAVWDLNKLYLYLNSEYTGRNKTRQSQAAFMKAILEYLSNLGNGNKVSIICTLVKNNIEKSRQIIEIDFTAVKQSGIDIDMKNDSITLPIGWESDTYNSVANIDCNIHINTKEISEYEGYSYMISSMTEGVTITNDQDSDEDDQDSKEFYISDCKDLALGYHPVLLKVIITHTVDESTKTYEILKQVPLHITNKDFYYLEFITKSLNSVINSDEITLNVYYNIYKYENGKSIKLSDNQENLWISVSNAFDTNVSYNNPEWIVSKNTYVIKNIPILYNVTDYTFTLATLEDGNYIILDYVELPVIYYGKSDRRIYYLMQLTKGYELPNMFITYDLSYAMINAVHTYFKNTSSLSYEDFVDGFYTFVIDSVGSVNYTVTRKEDADWYYSHEPESANQYICLIAVGSTAFGVSPLSPYEYYSIQLMEGTEYGKFGNIIINSSLGQDGYGRRYIYLKTDKIIEDIDNYYLNQEEPSRNINNCQNFLDDEFYPKMFPPEEKDPIVDGNDIWSDNILEPDVYQKYVYEFSDKKVNNIWLPFTSFILRSHFDSVFQFNNDNNNIVVDDDALDDDVKEITKTRFSFFDGKINNKLYIVGISNDSRNIYVSTSKDGNAEYTIFLDYSGLLITELSFDDDTQEFIQYTLGRQEGKFIASKFLLTYSIYKYKDDGDHHGELMAISNLNITVKDFSSGEIYKIITNPTLIGVRAVDNTETSYVLEDLYKSGGSMPNLNLYFHAYSNGSITSLINDNELNEDFYFTIDGVQYGLNLFDHCVYEELSGYNTKYIQDIIFKTDQYSFTSQASSRLDAEKCGSIVIDGIKRDIKYYKSGNYRYLYCAYDDSGDSYYFYVQRDGNDYTTWKRVTGSESLDVIFVSFTTIGNGFISDSIAFEGDHFEIKIEEIFTDTALPNLISLFYQGGDFILDPTIVDSLTISYVKAGLRGDDVLPIIKYTIEPLNAIFLVDEDGKYASNNLLLSYHVLAEYGTTFLEIDNPDVRVTINGTNYTKEYDVDFLRIDNGLTYNNGYNLVVTLHDYNELESTLLKLNIKINCNFTCHYIDTRELSLTNTRIVSMFATPISSSSPNITYEFIPMATTINLVWSYGSSYYYPDEVSGTLNLLIGSKKEKLTLYDGDIKKGDTKLGEFYWDIIDKNGDSIETKTSASFLFSSYENLDCYAIKFIYNIQKIDYVYLIPVNKGQLQEYFISVKGTADGDYEGSSAALATISLLEGTTKIDNIGTLSGHSEGILLAIFDTSNKLTRVNNAIYYNLSLLNDLYNILDNTYKDSKYIICLASYKSIKIPNIGNYALYSLLQQFGLGDLKYVQINNNAAMTPFAFIGCYGLAKGKACYQESQALATASSVEISAKIVDGTLDFSKAGEDAQYIYLKGDARNGDNSGEFGNSCEVRINNGQNVAKITRGTNLVTINRKELNVVESISYDTYSEAHPSGTGTGITDLKEKLDELNNDVFVCLVSSDAIGWDEDLINKLYDYGMELLPYTEVGRYPFLFIGYKGLGKGNGFTRMNDIATPTIPVELSVYIANGAFTSKDGNNISKQNEVAFYIVDNTSSRPTENDSRWSLAKPSSWAQGLWLHTKTVITWSDNNKTVLYTDEYNPNDGIAGLDIIVDGNTEMKYCVRDSNTTHPIETSSEWKDLDKVTLTQGKWLWSKATTYYRKSGSPVGEKDAGHSVNYNVSYISKDGKTGRGIKSITEYYQATNSSAARLRPESTTGWNTNPNSPNWGADAKYLWNMEETVYTDTTEYSIPLILAIWTTDGRGIDSILNKYCVTNSNLIPAKDGLSGAPTWYSLPLPLAPGQYLWNYEIITFINPSGTEETEVQMIGYAGTNGKNGDPGNNGYPGCVTRMFKTNVVAGKTYYNQTLMNPSLVDDGVCKLDYMVVYTNQKYYAFVCKLTHSVELDGLQPAVTNPFITVTTEQGQEYVLVNNYNVVPGSVKNPNGTNHDDVLSCQELWEQVSNMDGSAFFTSFTAVSGYIETLSGSAILLTDGKNINAGFRSSNGLSDNDVVLWSGSELPKGSEITGNAVSASANNATFKVTKNGVLYAKQGVFEGNVLSIPKVEGLWISLYYNAKYFIPTISGSDLDYSGGSCEIRLIDPNFVMYETDQTYYTCLLNGILFSSGRPIAPYVPFQLDGNIKFIYNIDSGMSCIANRDDTMLIDLPCYTDEYATKYVGTTTDRKDITDKYQFIANDMLGTVDLGKFDINPTLLHKFINLIYYDNCRNDGYEIAKADVYNIANNDKPIGTIKYTYDGDITNIKTLNLNDEDTKKLLGKIRETEIGYRLWVESFIGKTFTLIIPGDKIDTISLNLNLILPQKGKIFVRGIGRGLNSNVYYAHEKYVLPTEVTKNAQSYGIDCRYLIKSQYRRLSSTGSYIFTYGADGANNFDASDIVTAFSYFDGTGLSDSRIFNFSSNTSGDTALTNPVIIFKFKCYKECNVFNIIKPDYTYFDVPYINIYWALESYEIQNANLTNITVENKAQYF